VQQWLGLINAIMKL